MPGFTILSAVGSGRSMMGIRATQPSNVELAEKAASTKAFCRTSRRKGEGARREGSGTAMAAD
jgi:hypothetical protein